MHDLRPGKLLSASWMEASVATLFCETDLCGFVLLQRLEPEEHRKHPFQLAVEVHLWISSPPANTRCARYRDAGPNVHERQREFGRIGFGD